MESPRVLEPFQPSEPDTWEDYVERFEFFAEAQGITDASKRRATFLSYCGPETFKLAKALLAPAKLSETSLKDILACLTSHLAPTETKMARRMEFHKRQQHAGESVSAFLAELRKLAQHCDFQNLEETLLDRFIGGLSSKKARRRIVAKEEVTLASALKEATATENYEREELDASRKAPKPQIEVAHAMDELEATPSQSPVRGVESDCHYVTEINGRVVQFPAQGKAHVKVKIEGQQCDMEVDSGSGFTIVSDQTARTFFPRELEGESLSILALQKKKPYCIKAVEESQASQDRPKPAEVVEAKVAHCYAIKQDNLFLKNAGEIIWIEGRRFLGLKDTGSQVTIVHPEIICPTKIIPRKVMRLKGISKQPEVLPVAEIHVKFQDWSGQWQVAISEEIPTTVLIGWDLLEHEQSSFVVTHSKGGQQSPDAEGNATVVKGDRAEEQISEGRNEALLVPFTKNQKPSFAQEQKEDADLINCFEAAQTKQKTWYDKKARVRTFEPNSEVLLLRPTKGNKMQLAWKEPYKIVSKMSDVNYIIQQGEEGRQVVRVNMLKPYLRPEGWTVYAIREDPDEADRTCWEGRGEQLCNLQEIKIAPTLTLNQQVEVKQILPDYKEIFSNTPGRAKGVVHHIDTGDAEPIAVTPYRITGEYVGKVSNEVREMLKAGIITPSESPWVASKVLLDKPEGSIRFCLDYRKLNHVTKADAYPMPHLDDLIEAIGQCHYITCLDLTKGYYQVKMDPRNQEKTVFRSRLGQFEFKECASHFSATGGQNPERITRVHSCLFRRYCCVQSNLG
ncbi:Hypothetical predicted protein [Podarcis lilfordi]|uniref:Reverse transcriptase domain-containing protein n=5 Tax=Podarcis lilfordi TaxID=74358 RepID=A0AA35KB14_9SAUR|nr:Hypothetical predicted protein [Podarcis lilfordi]